MYVLERVQHRVPEEALRVSTSARPGPCPAPAGGRLSLCLPSPPLPPPILPGQHPQPARPALQGHPVRLVGRQSFRARLRRPPRWAWLVGVVRALEALPSNLCPGRTRSGHRGGQQQQEGVEAGIRLEGPGSRLTFPRSLGCARTLGGQPRSQDPCGDSQVALACTDTYTHTCTHTHTCADTTHTCTVQTHMHTHTCTHAKTC